MPSSKPAACALLLAAITFAGASCRTRPAEPEAPGEEVDGRVVRLYREPIAIPSFQLTDLEGRPMSSDDWRGKVVFVNFWATWCGPCRAEIPDLIALQEKYRDEIVIVGVSEDELPIEQVKKFATKYRMNYSVAMTTPAVRKIFRGVVALPTTFVLDREGRLVQKHVGLLNAVRTELEARVLAGLKTDAKVEHVDSADKVRLAKAAEAKTLPGLDLTKLTDTQRRAAVEELIASDCTCGCGLTLAECRLDDPDCPVSLPLAKAVVAKHAAN